MTSPPSPSTLVAAEPLLLKLADCVTLVIHLRQQLEQCKRLDLAAHDQDAVVAALARAELEKSQLEAAVRQVVNEPE